MKLIKRGLIILFFALMLTGCDMNNKDVNSNISVKDTNIEGTEQESVWGVNYIEFEKEYSYMSVTEDAIYGSFEEQEQAVIVRLNKENGEIENKFPIQGISYIQFFNVDDEGHFKIVGQEGENRVFARVMPDGNMEEIQSFILEDLEGLSRISSNCSLRGIYRDSRGYTYMWYNMAILLTELYENAEENVYGHVSRVYVKDEQLNTIFYEQVVEHNGTEVLD